MTIQINGSALSVIPVVCRSVEIPPFLKSKLYLDFTAQTFDESLQHLLLALEKGIQAVQRSPLRRDVPPTTFVQRGEEIPGMQESPWFQEFKNAPIVQSFSQAIRVQSFSGDIANELLLELARVSHKNSDARSLNGLLALAGFLADVLDIGLVNEDAGMLFRRIAEDQNIEQSYRMHAIGKVPELFTLFPDRHSRLSILPNLFVGEVFDPVADELVRQFLSPAGFREDSLLSSLWRLDVPSYRREILEYLTNSSNWKGQLRHSADLHLSKRPEELYSVLRPQWAGLDADGIDSARVAQEERWMATVLRTPNADLSRVLRTSEWLHRAGSAVGTKVLMAMLDQPVLGRLYRENGEAQVFKALIRMLVSPYVDIRIPVFAFLEIEKRFGIEYLRCDARLPGALVVPKKGGGGFRGSIIDGLVYAAADGDAGSSSGIRTLLQIFPRTPLVVAIFESCKTVNPPTPSITSLIDYLGGFEFHAHAKADWGVAPLMRPRTV